MKVHDDGALILKVWQKLVKPGIHQIAQDRQQEIEYKRNQHLQMLFLKQHIYTTYLQDGDHNAFGLLRETQMKIEQQKIILQARTDTACQSENTLIFHHQKFRALRALLSSSCGGLGGPLGPLLCGLWPHTMGQSFHPNYFKNLICH